MRYFLIGFMGSGKTYWGTQWGQAYQLPVFDLDQEIEKAQNKTIASLFKEQGEDAFRRIEHNMLLRYFEQDNFILSCGGGTPCFFNNIELMNKNGVTIYLKSTPHQLAQRLQTEKETRPLIKDVDDALLEEFIAQKLNTRIDCYSKAMYHLPVQFITNDNFDRIKFRHEISSKK